MKPPIPCKELFPVHIIATDGGNYQRHDPICLSWWIKCTFPCKKLYTYYKLHNSRMVSDSMQNPVKILVVDDSPTICLFMTRALERAGYRVITASNGNEGLQKTLYERPQCVVVDVVLPGGISGFSLCRQIRTL